MIQQEEKEGAGTPRIKLCGLSRPEDIETANLLCPDYIGFVFFEKSSRNVTPDQAAFLKSKLTPGIQAVGVFVDADPDFIAELAERKIIDLAQLHGHEDETYITELRQKTNLPLIQAFRVATAADAEKAVSSSADYILLDSGAGTGHAFDWSLIREIKRPYFLAGGLNPENVTEAVQTLRPWAVDVSSGIETNKVKDPEKMKEFVSLVRNS